MGSFWGKEPSSRIGKSLVLQWTSTGFTSAACTTAPFSAQVQQIRIIHYITGGIWANVDNFANITAQSSAGGVGCFIPAATSSAEYFAVTPGEVLQFASTSTSSGAVIVTEMW